MQEVALMDFYEKTISSQQIFAGRIINVKVDTVTLPDGSTSTREIVSHAGAVAVIPIDQEGMVWMVRQYRKALERVLLEIPAGTLEPGEQPQDCAVRELEEETGLSADTWEPILSYYSAPGFCDEQLHLYLARDLKTGESHTDRDEFVEVVKMSLEEAHKAIFSGEIIDGKSIIAIQYAYNQRERL
ncbi:MAG: NUDIX hydrolase [Syntrophomonadaceae bacterium]|nr:NUDIX hydrolase [Syntrophomonadaceae bacterium]